MAIGKPILEISSQGQKRSTTQILTLSDPKIRGQDPKTLSKRAHNPLLKEAGLTKPTAAHPSGGPVAGGAIGTSGMPLTASGRERPPDSDASAGVEKLGVIQASYASAIIGVLITPARKFRMLLHINPTRQRGKRTGSLARTSGWYMTFFAAGVIAPCRLIVHIQYVTEIRHVTEPGNFFGQIPPFLPARRRPTVDHSLAAGDARQRPVASEAPA